MTSAAEQRRYPRYDLATRAAVVIGPKTFVFAETINVSRGGTCLRLPGRFTVRIGEELNLSVDRMGAQRAARLVHISPAGLHFVFIDEPTDRH